jgi:hypothetical protein
MRYNHTYNITTTFNGPIIVPVLDKETALELVNELRSVLVRQAEPAAPPQNTEPMKDQ